MKIRANNIEIPVMGVYGDSIQQNGKTYPALKIEFPAGVTSEQLIALCSGTLEILDDSGNVIGTHIGYTTRRGLSFVVGKIQTAEQERDEFEKELSTFRSVHEEYKGQVETILPVLEDKIALTVKGLFPKWEDCVKLGSIESPEGFRFVYNGKLYKCKNANPVFQADWIPDNGTESLYERIDEEHAGTLDDPIPYDGNMALVNGLYYVQDGVIYLCNRDTGNAVYNPLNELVGLYVEAVN